LISNAGRAGRNHMGGMYGRVRGRTKLGTWIEFKRERVRLGLVTREDQQSRGFHLSYPANKRDALKRMRRNGDDSGWILEYHFRK